MPPATHTRMITMSTDRQPPPAFGGTVPGIENWRREHVAEGLRQADAGEFATDQEVAEVYDRPKAAQS